MQTGLGCIDPNLKVDPEEDSSKLDDKVSRFDQTGWKRKQHGNEKDNQVINYFLFRFRPSSLGRLSVLILAKGVESSSFI